jgi:hypothetical protein
MGPDSRHTRVSVGSTSQPTFLSVGSSHAMTQPQAANIAPALCFRLVSRWARRRGTELAVGAATPTVQPLDSRGGEMGASDVLKLAKEKGAKIVDLRFIDMPGLWQHFSIPVGELTESLFTEGIGFDGSSIRGFQAINESDMLLFPDPDTAVMDPFCSIPTLVMICNIKDPVTGQDYGKDPRYIARKAEKYLQATGIADTAYFGPELEFFILDSARFDQSFNYGFYYIDSDAGTWNRGTEGTAEKPNLGYRPRTKEGYFPVSPADHFQDLRSEMVLNLESVGVKIEVHHHEVASAGQTEIDMRFDTLVKMADSVPSRSCRSRSSRTTARACTRTSRCGRAARTCSSRRAATRTSPTCASTTSEAS